MTDEQAAPPPPERAPAPAAAEPRADDPLEPAITSMDGGDLREARRLAEQLAAQSDDAEVRARAVTLLGQLAPDRVIIAVMALSGLLGVVLALLYFGRS